MNRLAARVLGVPLVAKLIGANILIVALAVLLQALAFAGRGAEVRTVIGALTAALVANLLLVRLALKPIGELEKLAQRVWDGEFDARGVPSPYADRNLARLRDTVNGLLDSLAAERSRIHDLGAHVVAAHDVERASVSRELHDSVAQTLAAVRFQLSAAQRETDPTEVRNNVAAANAMISATMEEIVNVSYSLHSRVAEDLGIEAALRTLAIATEKRTGVEVDVQVRNWAKGAPPTSGVTSSTLYKVAAEALRAMEGAGNASFATIDLLTTDDLASVAVTHDGMATSLPALQPGLLSVKDRVLLAGGKMTIEPEASGGMRVIAELRTMRAAS